MPLQLPVEGGGLPEMSHLLNTHFTGIAPEEMNRQLMSLSEQVSGQWFLLLNQVVEYAGELSGGMPAARRSSPAAPSQLLKFPEYRDADKAHDLMSFMVDNKEKLPVPKDDAPMQILIGPENVNEALKDSSVVVASYDIGDNMRGLVGRGRPHPDGLRRRGRAAELLCREPEPHVRKAAASPRRGE